MQKISAGKFHFEPPFTSFDHLVGGGEQRWRHREAEYPGSLRVEDQFELCCSHHRQVRRLSALKDAASLDAELTIGIRQAGPVAHQPADFDIVTLCICCGDRMARR